MLKLEAGRIDKWLFVSALLLQLQVFAAGYDLESGTPHFSAKEARNLIGFALNQTSITPNSLLQSENDVALFGTVIVLCNILAVFPMWAVIVLTRPLRQAIVVDMAYHVGAISVVFLVEIGLVLSCIAELVMSAVWTAKNSGGDLHLCIWMRLTFILIYMMGPVLIYVMNCIAAKQFLPQQALALVLSQIVYIFIIFSLPTFLYSMVFPTAVATIFLHFACVSLLWSIVTALSIVLQENQERNVGTSGACSQCWNKWILDPKITVVPLIYITVYTMTLIFPMAFGGASVMVFGSLPFVPLFFLILFNVLLWIILKLKVSSDSFSNDAVSNTVTDPDTSVHQSNANLASSLNITVGNSLHPNPSSSSMNTSVGSLQHNADLTNSSVTHRAGSSNTNRTARQQSHELVEAQLQQLSDMDATFESDEGLPLIPHGHRRGYDDVNARYGVNRTTNFDSEDGELFQSCTSTRANV